MYNINIEMNVYRFKLIKEQKMFHELLNIVGSKKFPIITDFSCLTVIWTTSLICWSFFVQLQL